MLFTKKISRILAQELAANYAGTIQTCNAMFGAFATCHYQVEFIHKNMRVEAYPFWPYSHIWVQNFVLKQNVNFSIGKALPNFGLNVPRTNFFSDRDITIFSHDAYDLDATRIFCRKIENEMDIVGLKLGKGEYLCISNGQMVLQNKNIKFDGVVERIDVLADIFENNVKIQRVALPRS